MKCPNCNSPEEHGRFCSRCGDELPRNEYTVPQRGYAYSPRGDYRVLRCVSSIIFIVGLILTVGSVFSSWLVFSYVHDYMAINFSSGSSSKYNALTNSASVFATVAWVAFTMGGGLLQIAASQLIQVFLDIRDDTRKTVQFLMKN